MLYFLLSLSVAIFGMANINSVGGQLILTGTAMNATCYVSNGYMPVYNSNVDLKWWAENNDGIHKMNPLNANFPFLGDWWIMPNNLTISPGDILAIAGVVMIVYNK